MRRVMLIVFGAVLVSVMYVGAAQAQATRTWVSGVGDDANPCSRTAPCKTFAGAISKTAAGGEISVLDPGGFGAVTITKSITINGTGTLARILASLTNGIIVNAAVTDKVIIRNISINGVGNGINGIRLLAAAQLTVENVTIEGFTGNCIDVALGSSSDVLLQDVNMTRCNNGVSLSTTAGQLLATMDQIRAENMANHGIRAFGSGPVLATVKRSIVSNNNNDGIRTDGAAGTINVDDSVLSYNAGTAIDAVAVGSRIRISNNTIVHNGGGVGFL